ncbi:hypothetical protein [Actinomadura opuntiae]|nr:hypothetical protein [Actinomadura sp. OS1-43]MDL4817789.1 hypothetical protein [Actinomadura sp. OS1-43]
MSRWTARTSAPVSGARGAAAPRALSDGAKDALGSALGALNS